MENDNNVKSSTVGWVIGIIVVIIIIVGIVMWKNSENSATQSASQNQTSAQTASSTAVSQPETVDSVAMSPQNTILQNASEVSDLSTFVSAVQAAGLTSLLNGPGPLTVFVPSNEAFEQLPAGELATLMQPVNKPELVNLLEYHIVPGTYTVGSLTNGENLGTMFSRNIVVSKSTPSATVTLNGTAVAQDIDITSSNGVMYVINAVLIPPATTTAQ